MPLDTATALRLLLERVDYTAGACKPHETVGAVVSYDVLQQCRDALERNSLNQGKKPGLHRT